MQRAVLLALALLFTAPTLVLAEEHGDAHAEDGEHAAAGEHAEGHGGPISFTGIVSNPEFMAAVLNFALLLFVLRKLGGQSLSKFLSERRTTMELSIAEAAQMKVKAEIRYNEYTAKMATLDAELKKLHEDMRRAAVEEDARIAAEAEESARRMKAETESLIAQYAQQLTDTVRREVVEAAVAAAHEVLSKSVSQSDQEKLAESFRQRIAALSQHARPSKAPASKPASTLSTGSQS